LLLIVCQNFGKYLDIYMEVDVWGAKSAPQRSCATVHCGIVDEALARISAHGRCRRSGMEDCSIASGRRRFVWASGPFVIHLSRKYSVCPQPPNGFIPC